jgi:hypothetical protein
MMIIKYRLRQACAGTRRIMSRFVKASLSRDHELIYQPIQQFWDAAVSGDPVVGSRPVPGHKGLT